MKSGKMTRYVAISTISSLILRGIGLLFNVYLTNKTGAEGIGLMTVIGSVYALGVSFSAAGYKLAATRLAIEDENGEHPNPARLIGVISLFALATGLASLFALYFSSGFISRKILCDLRCERALKVLAFSLPLLAVEGVLSAYLSAFYKLIKCGIIQLAAQCVQIAAVVISAVDISDTELFCTRLAFGSVIGEAAGLIAAAVFTVYEIGKKRRTDFKAPLIKPFLRIAVPDALGYNLRSCLSTVQHLLIPIGFRKSGSSAASALAVYGVMHGMAFPVILFPSAVLRALAGILVPTVAESVSVKNDFLTRRTVRRVLHLTSIFSFAVMSVMFFCADGISEILYKNSQCAEFMRLFSPLIPIMYADICIDAMLKGIDKQVASMGYNLLDSLLSVVLIYFLVPKYGVTGYIIMVFVTESLNTFMSLRKLTVESGVGLSPLYDIIFPLICAAVSGFISRFLISVGGVFTMILQIAATVLIFSALMCILSAETRENLLSMSGIKEYGLS